ncbi:MAG: Fe-S cluster assembly ATPase SufC [Candidatus Makana argininalis]
MLLIKNLTVNIEKKKIIKKLNLKIKSGEIHAIMGPNGSGKSTLTSTLAGKNKNNVINGSIIFKNKNLLLLNPEYRACEGLFISFQYPIFINGVSNKYFLQLSTNSIRKYKKKNSICQFKFNSLLKKNIELIKIPIDIINRSVNKGFSGGEKKKNEILQMMMLKPDLCILDEIDSGLDIDALKIISNIINSFKNYKRSIIIITHYQRIFKYIKPDYVHILYNGKIIRYSNYSLAKYIEDNGYGFIKK